MDLGIAGQVAIVTAASKGLGLASARALAAEGACVAITGRDAATLQPVAARLEAETGQPVLAIAGDITDPSTPAAVVARTVERFGRLDIVVANAGGPPAGGAFDVTDEMITAAVNANLLATVRLVREAVPHLAAAGGGPLGEGAGGGRICCITSVTVVEPIPTLALSNVARLGLRGWAKTAAAELVDKGITLNLVCPGLHETDRVKELGHVGRSGDPAEFGQVVAFLCSRQAGFINGTTLVVDGGATKGV